MDLRVANTRLGLDLIEPDGKDKGFTHVAHRHILELFLNADWLLLLLLAR